MAYERDELNNRRDPARWRREMARARQRRLYLLGGIAMLAVALFILGVLLYRNFRREPADSQISTAPPSSSAPSTRPQAPETVITLVAGGDLNVTDSVVASGENAGRYDYTSAFLDVAPVLARADAAVLNLEGNLCGSPYGSAAASAPQELAQALAAAGVDMIQTANSYTVNNGLTGLSATLNGIRAAGMEPVGAFSSNAGAEAAQGFTLCDIGGIRVAFVAFTKGLGGLGLPAGSEKCVNLLYTDYTTAYQKINTAGIKAVLKAVREQEPDVTIALLHWGSEYNNIVSASQKKIVKLMQQEGVDAIIGTHSHYVQQVDYEPQAGTVVAYSLGDFYGDAERAGTQYSILLELEITRDNTTGKTKITDCDYIPVYTLTPERDGEAMRVVRIREAMAQYENDHVGKVTAAAYENMKAALERIRARVGEKE